MIHIEAKIQVKPDLVESFLNEVELVIQGSLSETGNHGYELVRSVKNTSIFYILEKWADEAAIQFHNSTDHYKRFKREVPAFLEFPTEVVLLTKIEQ
ncbi:putative quinol monooxygenase [Listeria monocytogenes]|uniref:Antibiotic biosynthesis monooxygenase n=1 Tax=Listeria monocytogenes TaxID=1639 RepID=A0A6Z2TL94_LISMN|nr:putative quinol monooxygenase [Listeria monocytogenes]EFR83409.1 monooxygenase family protein [Listeria monocytogenes FSL F2-208]EAC6874076.1 antibiotic biosynthesis monooxygenase [Listeria monocytogenes]EAC7886500.1 antibiotic biosynthesis monooxygenase [Listeria monocytogenes]EAC8434859.1 antibiotic biosynthesis monooxygenase [Listeria monocytogenes]EAC8464317.1 antibiotic biosynthesis monooxygenase [Listeria monocytogenes]